jgi:hypothetical protein
MRQFPDTEMLPVPCRPQVSAVNAPAARAAYAVQGRGDVAGGDWDAGRDGFRPAR